MFVGTAYFVSKKAAIKYYKTQECDKETVEKYIKEGLIIIGYPSVPNAELYVDKDGRVWRVEK